MMGRKIGFWRPKLRQLCACIDVLGLPDRSTFRNIVVPRLHRFPALRHLISLGKGISRERQPEMRLVSLYRSLGVIARTTRRQRQWILPLINLRLVQSELRVAPKCREGDFRAKTCIGHNHLCSVPHEKNMCRLYCRTCIQQQPILYAIRHAFEKDRPGHEIQQRPFAVGQVRMTHRRLMPNRKIVSAEHDKPKGDKDQSRVSPRGMYLSVSMPVRACCHGQGRIA